MVPNQFLGSNLAQSGLLASRFAIQTDHMIDKVVCQPVLDLQDVFVAGAESSGTERLLYQQTQQMNQPGARTHRFLCSTGTVHPKPIFKRLHLRIISAWGVKRSQIVKVIWGWVITKPIN